MGSFCVPHFSSHFLVSFTRIMRLIICLSALCALASADTDPENEASGIYKVVKAADFKGDLTAEEKASIGEYALKDAKDPKVWAIKVKDDVKATLTFTEDYVKKTDTTKESWTLTGIAHSIFKKTLKTDVSKVTTRYPDKAGKVAEWQREDDKDSNNVKVFAELHFVPQGHFAKYKWIYIIGGIILAVVGVVVFLMMGGDKAETGDEENPKAKKNKDDDKKKGDDKE